MKRYSFQILSIFIIALIVVSQSFASWQKETVHGYNTDGIIDFTYTIDINQSGQQSYFTMYKQVAGMRVYMTFFGVTWPEFKNYMQFNSTTPKIGTTLPDGNVIGDIGGIDLTSFESADSIDINMYISDHFGLQYGEQLKVAINICGNLHQTYGSMPDVNINVGNADISSVTVTYVKPPVSVNADTQVVANISGGLVTVKCNDGGATYKYGGGIGGVIVNGGFIGNIDAPKGIAQITASARRISLGKKKLARLGFGQNANAKATLLGGVIGGDITTKGQIVNIYAGNGLGAPSGPGVINGMDKPKIACGYDGASYHGRSIKKIIAKRGAWKATVSAGSAPSTSNPDFLGGIAKVIVTSKKKGAINYDDGASLSNGCNFISYNRFKLCGSGVKKKTAFCASSFNVVPWGTIPLDKNFVKKASKLP